MAGKTEKRPTEQTIDSWKISPAEKDLCKALFNIPPVTPNTVDEMAERVRFAFAVMTTQSWKACRYKICRRAQRCRWPKHAASDPAISAEHREEMKFRRLPPCLVEPGWLDTVLPAATDEMKRFSDGLKILKGGGSIEQLERRATFAATDG